MGGEGSGGKRFIGLTHRPLGSSFLGLPFRIVNINHKKELLRGLWVGQKLGVGSVLWLGAVGVSWDVGMPYSRWLIKGLGFSLALDSATKITNALNLKITMPTPAKSTHNMGALGYKQQQFVIRNPQCIGNNSGFYIIY